MCDALNTHIALNISIALSYLPQDTRPCENTLNAYIEAARAGAVAVECDVWSSRDSKVNRSMRDFEIRFLTKGTLGVFVSRRQLGFTEWPRQAMRHAVGGCICGQAARWLVTAAAEQRN